MQIRQLSIQRYRGIETFTWKPNAGVNCLIGPGDSLKSTVLAAISLLLAPYPLGACSEFDYYRRRIAEGFEIEAYIGNIDLEAFATEQRLPHLHGWQDHAPVPLPEGQAEPVLRCRVRGTADLELAYDLPAEGMDPSPPFSASLRRKLMLSRLASEERASRDLRLGTGSLLDRHLKTSDMRAPVHSAVAGASAAMELPAPAQSALAAVRQTFEAAGLAADLHLGLMPAQGAGLVGMVALMSGANVTEAVPVANAGTGTRQMALLSLSAALAGAAPIIVIDEPERGLEPYRQRGIAKKAQLLAGDHGQVFLTTHAPAILETVAADSVWRMRPGQEPLRFEGPPLAKLLRSDPEAFFAPVPILCEGDTEAGLLDEWLPGRLAPDLDGHGVRLVDGGGQPSVLEIAEMFIKADIRCGVFLDNEHEFSGRRTRMRDNCAAFIWTDAINIENAVTKWLPLDGLFALIADAAEATGIESRYLVDQVHAKIPETERRGGPREIQTAGHPEETLRTAFYETMTARRSPWFKSREGGRILARALARIGMPLQITAQLDQFVGQLRSFVR